MAARSAESLAAAQTLLRRRAPKLHGCKVEAVEQDEAFGSVILLLSTEPSPGVAKSGALTAELRDGELRGLHLGWPPLSGF